MQGNDDRFAADAWLDRGHDAVGLRGLYHKYDHVHNADILGGVGGMEAGEELFARGSDKRHSALRDLVHVRLVAVNEPKLCAAFIKI